MKLYHSAASPYVRKVLASAQHLGLADRIELLPSAASPLARDMTIAPANPLGKVPTMLIADGSPLIDSRSIVEYLVSLGSDPGFLPAPGPARWEVLRLHAIADGLLDSALLARYEVAMRPPALLWPEWLAGQMGKIDAAVAALEQDLPGIAGPVTLATVTAGCALGYLDFRFAHHDWRKAAPGLAGWWSDYAQTPPMALTRPG